MLQLEGKSAFSVERQKFTANPSDFSTGDTEISRGGSQITISGTLISLKSSAVLVSSSTVPLASVTHMLRPANLSGLEITVSRKQISREKTCLSDLLCIERLLDVCLLVLSSASSATLDFSDVQSQAMRKSQASLLSGWTRYCERKDELMRYGTWGLRFIGLVK